MLKWINFKLISALVLFIVSFAYITLTNIDLFASLSQFNQDADIHSCSMPVPPPEGWSDDTMPPGWSSYTQVDPPAIPSGVDVRKLQSFPEANALIYLNFDGGTTIKGTYEPSGKTDAEKYGIWLIVSEDYAPFKVNVTTDKNLYESVPKTKSSIVMISPTINAPYKSVSGYNWGGIYSADQLAEVNAGYHWASVGETISHEIGHSLSLRHSSTIDTEYYYGHGYWAPIMGAGGYKPVTHWDMGEFQNALISEENYGNFYTYYNYSLEQMMDKFIDRIKIIARGLDVTNTGSLAYRDDDHGNNISNATELTISNGVITGNNHGIISTRDDKDVFSFTVNGNTNVSLHILPHELFPNLNIQAELYNGLGDLIAMTNPAAVGKLEDAGFQLNFDAKLSKTLSSGTYYIVIDGVGEGDPKTTGFSDYGSLGYFSVTGTIPGVNQVGTSSSLYVSSSSISLSSSSSSMSSSSSQVLSSSVATTCGSYIAWVPEKQDWKIGDIATYNDQYWRCNNLAWCNTPLEFAEDKKPNGTWGVWDIETACQEVTTVLIADQQTKLKVLSVNANGAHMSVNSNSHFQLFSPIGRIVQTGKATNGILRWNHSLKPGLYYLRLDGQTTSIRIQDY